MHVHSTCDCTCTCTHASHVHMLYACCVMLSRVMLARVPVAVGASLAGKYTVMGITLAFAPASIARVACAGETGRLQKQVSPRAARLPCEVHALRTRPPRVEALCARVVLGSLCIRFLKNPTAPRRLMVDRRRSREQPPGFTPGSAMAWVHRYSRSAGWALPASACMRHSSTT